MKKHPKITVYIASHNYGVYLDGAIASVLRQSSDEWELFLINDGSTDDTQKIFEKYKSHPNVRIFTTDNIGLPAVANLALKHASGEYLIRLDGDDFFDENILLVLSRYLDTHPDVALVFPDYYLVDDQGGLIRQEVRNPVLHNKHLQDMPAHGACTMIRTSVLKEIGGYREDLRAQDGFEIWTKIIKTYPCGNVNLPLFSYRRHGANLTNNASRIVHARQTIKKDAVTHKLKEQRPIIAIIPCRQGYDIEPDLWRAEIHHELTLLDVAIRTSLGSSLFDHVVVTSDTPDVREVMKKYDDPRLVFIPRAKKDTAPSGHIFDTIQKVTAVLDPAKTGISVLSYIQAPFTTTKTLEEAVYTLLLNDADSSLAVQEITTNLYKRSETGLIPLHNQDTRRTDFDVIYSDARATFATKNGNTKINPSTNLLGDKFVYFQINPAETFFITSKNDLGFVSYVHTLMSHDQFHS